MIQNVADSIHWQSPSDACLKIVCEKTKEAIKASCRVVSQAGTFMAEVVSDCPEWGIKKLEKEIQKQLNVWKQNRFSDIFNNQLEKAG